MLSFLLVSEVLASACCGGGSSLPTLITGDYQGQLVLSGSNSAMTHDSTVQGKLRKRDGNNQEVIETLTLSAAYLVSPYWQVGLTLPYKLNTRRTSKYEESSRGLSDIKAQVAYEFLPEYSFSLWKPRGYLFLEQTFPNSKSVYNAEKPLRSDSLGNGFYTTALGLSFVKAVSHFDFLVMTEIHKAFKRNFEENSEALSVRPKLGGSLLLGAGYSPFNGNLRLGWTLLYSKEGGREVQGEELITSEASSFWEIGANASYLFGDVSLSLGYRDQSFLGKASNTSLSKSVNVSLVKFFEL